MKPTVLIVAFLLVASAGFAQSLNRPGSHKHPTITGSSIPLVESSRSSIASEIGGAFMSGSKCDAEGNLYIRKLATDRPMLGPVVKIDAGGKRVALFDPATFSDPKLSRADAFSPAPDGGLYQIAGTGGVKPQVYVIYFSADGSAGSAVRLENDFEPHAFAAFSGGNLLVSGLQRELQNPSDKGRSFTGVFSADGRLLAQLSFEQRPISGNEKIKTNTKPAGSAESPLPTLDLSEGEAGADGNIYALRRSSPAMLYVISPAGKIERTLEVRAPGHGVMPNTFHVSGNRVAISFWDDEKRKHFLVVADSQTGRTIANYSDPDELGPSFACYSADEGVFTFLQLGEGNTMEVVRAETQ